MKKLNALQSELKEPTVLNKKAKSEGASVIYHLRGSMGQDSFTKKAAVVSIRDFFVSNAIAELFKSERT